MKPSRSRGRSAPLARRAQPGGVPGKVLPPRTDFLGYLALMQALKAFCKRAWARSVSEMAQIADVNREIEYSDRMRRSQRSENERLTAIIRAIDELMFSLEELNLQGIDRVPARLRERAGALIELVLARPAPVEARSDPFRIRYRVVPLMDVLCEVQDKTPRQRNPIRINAPEDQMESAS